MTDKERIEYGRKFAIGDGVCVDYERAYTIWKDVRFQLKGEDRELFAVIEDLICEAVAQPRYENPIGFSRAPTVSFAQSMTEKPTEAQIRALFERLMASGNYEAVYEALARLNTPKKAERAKKPMNKNFGNNMKFLLYQFGWSTSYFRDQLNELLRLAGLREKSVQAIYQIIGGVNGMNESGQMKTVELFNEADKKRRLMCRPLTVLDLQLPISEMQALFAHPKWDEKLKILLQEDSSAL